ncbi:hypothetical protein AALO_G00253600 [Alosa alosa]|uniref:Uncharacterized protein n=1 Tax=Alosa alosa TaxID=278164 RepID=A0AAV6FRM7_9TELE|nr:hypothetical protein AALO_G00253600 [Alosa alosa]
MKPTLVLLFVILIGGAYVWNGRDWEWVDGGEEIRPDDLLTRIRQTALGKDISDKVLGKVDTISQYIQDVGTKAESMFHELSRKVEQDAERFRSQVESHLLKRMDETLQVIQTNPADAAQNIPEQLTQGAGAIRNETESFIESLGLNMQTQLAAFWESLTKGN